MKLGAEYNTKMAMLMRNLSIPRYAAVGVMVMVWKLASRESPDGLLGKLSDEAIAGAVEWPGDPAKFVMAVLDSRWLDEDLYAPRRGNGARFLIHNWCEHAEDAVHARLCRERRFFACGRAPKISGGFRPKERAAIDQFYEANTYRIGDRRYALWTRKQPQIVVPQQSPIIIPTQTALIAEATPHVDNVFTPVTERTIRQMQESELTPEEYDAAWERHWLPGKGIKDKDGTFRMILSLVDGFDVARFRRNHPLYCAYWERVGWTNGYGQAVCMYDWIRDGMKPAPPIAVNGGGPGPASASGEDSDAALLALLNKQKRVG